MEDPNDSATEIIQDVQENFIPELQSKYPDLAVSFEGQNREAQKLFNSLNRVWPVILFLIFAVIAFTFRTYSQPVILILMIPFSIVGIAWGHYIHGFPINVLSFLGIIALIGIMVNDGLVLIGKFNSYLREGMKFEDALFSAGKSRFRAIFLTSLTTIAGLAPLLLEKSRQAQFLKPMAISISYGIAIATILTLYMLPLFLSVVNDAKTKIKWLRTGEKVDREDVQRVIKEVKTQEELSDHLGEVNGSTQNEQTAKEEPTVLEQ